MMKISKILLSFAFLVFAGIGCKKSYLDTDPTNQISNSTLFETTASAYTALNGIHSLLISHKLQTNHAEFGLKAFHLVSDMMGNDIVTTGSNYDHFLHYYRYTMAEPGSANYWGPYHIWTFFYRVINNANGIINNIDAADGPIDQKNDIKGQALAYRAWAYYELTIRFCTNITIDPNAALATLNANAPGVPIYTEPTTPESKGAPRGTIGDNYALINSDIEQAIELLLMGVNHGSNKSHISYYTALGIKSRIDLAQGRYQDAANAAIDAFGNYPLMGKADYTSGFNSSSNSEWMWASAYSDEQYEALGILSFVSFMDSDAPGYAGVGATRSITKALYDQIPNGDVRKEVFLQNLLQQKFKARNDNGFVFDNLYMRSAEMYLNAAEGFYRIGNESTAKDLLETLVSTRYDGYVAPSGGQALLNEILLQRRIELWGEGFSYTDIRRLQLPLARPGGGQGNHSQAIAGKLSLPRNSPDMVFKIPQREIDVNDSLDGSDQNP